jgi:hypothetical protein
MTNALPLGHSGKARLALRPNQEAGIQWIVVIRTTGHVKFKIAPERSGIDGDGCNTR